MKSFIRLLLWISLCLGVGFVGSIFTVSSIPTWYAGLNKPLFSPPNWIFGPVWTLLYILMGIAAYLNEKINRYFITQLVLNFLWSIIFFYLHQPLLAFIEIVFLWIFILLTIKDFYKKSRPAAYLLIPYLAWVSFASILNLAVVWLNP